MATGPLRAATPALEQGWPTMMNPIEPSAVQAEGSTLRPVSRSEDMGEEESGRRSEAATNPLPLERSSRKRGRRTPWFGKEWCAAKEPNACHQRERHRGNHLHLPFVPTQVWRVNQKRCTTSISTSWRSANGLWWVGSRWWSVAWFNSGIYR